MSLQLGKSNEEGSKGIKEAYLCVRGYACEKKKRDMCLLSLIVLLDFLSCFLYNSLLSWRVPKRTDLHKNQCVTGM